MPRSSLKAVSEARLAEARDSSERFACLAIDVVYEPEWERRGQGLGEVLLQVGGVWDRKEHAWAELEAHKALVLEIHKGQVDAFRWFARWLTAYLRGEKLEPPVFSIALVGGRRGGKSVALLWMCALFAVAAKGSIVWIVTQTHEEDEGDEVQRNLMEILPPSWYAWRDYKSTFELVNGSRIMLKSAYRPGRLKRGRADLVALNEAQLMSERVYITVRAPIADEGQAGLVILAANPPEDPIGYWVDDYVEETRAGLRAARVFEFDPEQNPAIDIEVLRSMRTEVDERTYRREVLGEFLPRADVCFYAFAPRAHPHGNLLAIPEVAAADVTAEFTRRHFGREYAGVMGADFQMTPHQAGVLYRFFRDPDEPDGEPLMLAVAAFVLEQADEDDLVDAWEAAGLVGSEIALVPDASGEWQRSDRKAKDLRGRGSWDMLRRRGWGHIYPPDKEMRRNPDIVERVAATNARFRTADSKRHLFIAPELEAVVRACKMWELRNGVPYRRSIYAHICDAGSYPVWRFYPRKRRIAGPKEYKSVERARTARRRDLDSW